ncbi:MAG: hypothetical protein ACOYN4_19345, partial [Bacteroidales bacterium]
MPPKIYVALPVMDEMERLPLLIKAIQRQSIKDFELIVCVNQPDLWWENPLKIDICKTNQSAILYLQSLNDKRITIIDKSSPGKGWLPKVQGIGVARKFLMDYISSIAENNDIIISMDADTVFNHSYFSSILENLRLNPTVSAIAVPYYHQLLGESGLDRAMLRYEIYMRSYAINMWRIKSPYSFTALGSAIALPVWAYKAVGGMTPKLSGEDFYFLQKIVKSGRLIHWNLEFVYPATRLSDRVFFGTGPALSKGISGDWQSYPIYNYQLFDLISTTTNAFKVLFTKDVVTPLDDFLFDKFGELPWRKLRQNFKTEAHFVRACHEKIDGLRILQFLKESQLPDEKTSENAL